MANTSTSETTCPACGGDGVRWCGDAWRGGRHVDVHADCDDCNGTGVWARSCDCCDAPAVVEAADMALCRNCHDEWLREAA